MTGESFLCSICGQPKAIHHSACPAASPPTPVKASATLEPKETINPLVNPWHPMTDPVGLKHLGKLGEELGECSAAVARCIIQGVDEAEPVTGKANREWLEDEIANTALVVGRFDLDDKRIAARAAKKIAQLRTWHDMA